MRRKIWVYTSDFRLQTCFWDSHGVLPPNIRMGSPEDVLRNLPIMGTASSMSQYGPMAWLLRQPCTFFQWKPQLTNIPLRVKYININNISGAPFPSRDFTLHRTFITRFYFNAMLTYDINWNVTLKLMHKLSMTLITTTCYHYLF